MAASETIKEFLVELGFNVDENSEKTFKSFLAGATVAVAGIAAAVAAASTGIFMFTQGVAEQMDDLGDLAHRINSTAGAVAEFGYIAQLSGSDVKTAQASLETFGKAAGDASLGLGRAKKVFEQIGVNVKDANGKLKSTTDLVWEVGAAIKDMERGKQSAILQRLGLDKTLLDTLTTDVSDLKQEFSEFFNQDEINKAAEDAGKFMDAWDRMHMVLGGIGKKIASKFFVPLTAMMERFTKFVAEVAPKIVNAIVPILDIILRLAQAMTTLAVRTFGIVFSAISTFIGWLSTINQATDGWLGKIALAIAAWKLLNLTILRSPIGMLAALGVAILALVDDFLVWKEGGDSLFNWSAWMPFFNALGAAIDWLKGLLTSFFTNLFDGFDAVKDLFSGDFKGAMTHAGNILSSVGGAADSIIFGSGAPDAAPSPQTQANLNGQTNNVNQKTEINVHGVGDPKQAASIVGNQQGRINDDMVRNMKGAAK